VAPAGAAYGDTLSPNSAGPSIAPQPGAVVVLVDHQILRWQVRIDANGSVIEHPINQQLLR
jgi:hypothetical protein